MAVSGDVVTAEALTKRYRRSETPAVDDVSFEIARGETIGLLGPNGAGKTTLIKMICGVTAPTSGRVQVFDADPVRQPVAAKSGIGAMHQIAPFDEMLPALDNLRISARFRGVRWRDVRPWALELAEFLGVAKALPQLCFQLSGGQRQRLQLIRALITLPGLLILDEPSAGLDVAGRHQIERFVTWLREEHGVTVLWTSHHIDELERNSQRVMVINRGRVLRFAKPRELVEEFGAVHLMVTVADAEAGAAVAAWARNAGLSADADDGEVRIEGARAREMLPELTRHCQDHDIVLSGVSTALDSLETVFLRMTADEG
ncbi:ABC transporter ATP-binding protein [Actinomadura sp. ATCC 31491]|uniref:ABC transporter ATP-binding protein n=1 Tax=Actinomadura luzonensis TaxID=2805427 RepID=A0ABT0G711_9ACTN|nr:ABC transporter ATP-binding protein [Actinomadura luzonensis]MCK2220388.1 ABC transporter ATP-binding protein [Actinomadura luzonensis]